MAAYAEKHASKREVPAVEEAAGTAAVGVSVEIDEEEFDKIMNETDEVLEENAEIIVSAFIQQGGQ